MAVESHELGCGSGENGAGCLEPLNGGYHCSFHGGVGEGGWAADLDVFEIWDGGRGQAVECRYCEDWILASRLDTEFAAFKSTK